MARIKRKTQGVRRSAAASNRAQTARRARARTGSLLDSAMAILPFTEDQLYRIGLAIIIGGAAALAWLVASLAGVPAMAGQQIALVAADAGFAVHNYNLRGAERMNATKVYNIVLAERDKPMPLVDLDQLRTEIRQLSWVEDARVSRQLPDTLVIDIVERTPRAVLRRPDKLVLIDGSGVELEPISPANAKGMLVISGPGAGKQVEALDRLLAAAPAIKPQVAEAEWVGNRRWNLTFRTSQVLALPQGKEDASGALINFARLDGANRLLGGKVAYFDMRAPDRIYMRIPGLSPQTLAADAKPQLVAEEKE